MECTENIDKTPATPATGKETQYPPKAGAEGIATSLTIEMRARVAWSAQLRPHAKGLTLVRYLQISGYIMSSWGRKSV